MLLKDLIADYLSLKKMSYRTFATKCGISPAYLSMIKNDLNPSTGKPPVVKIEMLYKIAKGLDMTTHELFDIVDDMPVDIGAPAQPQYEDVLYVSRPSSDMKANEIRRYLHETIDQLNDKDLEFFKDFTLRIKK